MTRILGLGVSLNDFKAASSSFRQGRSSAEAYCRLCMRLFGGRFTPIFEEIVALLPDKKMQRELVDAFAIVQQSSVLAVIQPA